MRHLIFQLVVFNVFVVPAGFGLVEAAELGCYLCACPVPDADCLRGCAVSEHAVAAGGLSGGVAG